MLHGFFAFFYGVLDWIVLILVWFERSLHSAQVSGQSCPWPLKLVTSQAVERMWICMGGYGQVRGEWVKFHELWQHVMAIDSMKHICLTVVPSWILGKVLKFAHQFSRPGKGLENRDKVLKKWLKVLRFFWKLQQVHNRWNFFVLVKSYSVSPVYLQCIMEKALFLCFFFKGLTLYGSPIW